LPFVFQNLSGVYSHHSDPLANISIHRQLVFMLGLWKPLDNFCLL